ncbi:LPS biosynthesis protein [Candidatus Curtissbacteria bacterium RIFCSPHIGHO2_02_FULL_40_17]|uniref:LPS biosynthesis protein n=3 Tax=Candidatus Curtissiibacteriota TaxID=1752717 RepID=A0A1F5GHN0_9BACT|nr:MAG: LPS biosynthesis protein [Candidatus Curtissbacteria bacterium RIFCSPHIGHO2_02_FULL_40_17]OGE04039.1 MAG: LPS biosynthesis protein [Candidatus Curtissbacteria bacterium RIFCSPHIGHO2_12_FULL_41_17]
MKYCTRCIYPANHPLNITFDNEGVCSGCRVHEEKDILDWDKRIKKLKRILDGFRNKSKENYDCIVPVSGARDSYFIVHTIKNIYKMNPLLVTYNKQYNTPIGIRNLAYLKTLFDCDLLTLTVNPKIVKKITKVTLQKMGSMYWHCLAGQTVFPVQTAVRFKIPLIIWGGHQGIDQVGMFSHLDEVEMTRKYRKEHDLLDYEAEDLIDQQNYLSREDLTPFIYPHDKEIERIGIRGIYLSNYIRWDSKKQHEDMIKEYGYQTAAQTRTFDTYNDVDCFNYSDVHDYIKFLKLGYGKATDHAVREIRLKRLTREEGINQVKNYQNKKPQNLQLFLDWIGMTELGFYFLIDQFRNLKIWRKSSEHNWTLKDSVTGHIRDEGVGKVRLTKKDSCVFQVSASKEPRVNSYILFGKGMDN